MEKRDVGITILILALLVSLGAAGEYNYQRNKAAEKRAAPRTYTGYSDDEIAALIEAYQQEVEVLEARYGAARNRTIETGSGGLIDEQIRENLDHRGYLVCSAEEVYEDVKGRSSREEFEQALQTAEHYGLFDLARIERMVLKNIAGDYFRLPLEHDITQEDDDDDTP